MNKIIVYGCGFQPRAMNISPKLGDLVFCQHCNTSQIVIRVGSEHLHKWRANCYDCENWKAERKEGTRTAQQMYAIVLEHMNIHPEHTVVIAAPDGHFHTTFGQAA